MGGGGVRDGGGGGEGVRGTVGGNLGSVIRNAWLLPALIYMHLLLGNKSQRRRKMSDQRESVLRGDVQLIRDSVRKNELSYRDSWGKFAIKKTNKLLFNFCLVFLFSVLFLSFSV